MLDVLGETLQVGIASSIPVQDRDAGDVGMGYGAAHPPVNLLEKDETMGTNYYLTHDVCPQCGRGDDRLHIGKSSGGWCFGLQVLPDEGLYTLTDWIAAWAKPGVIIKDEYGDSLTPEQMLAIITKRGNARDWSEIRLSPPYGYASWIDFHRCNYSEEGPSGLLRNVQDGKFCVGHGDGTWDLLAEDFS